MARQIRKMLNGKDPKVLYASVDLYLLMFPLAKRGYPEEIEEWGNRIRNHLNPSEFANFGTREQHGLARNRLWSLDDDPSLLTPANNQSTADLLLKSTEEDLKTWPYRFELRLRITVSAARHYPTYQHFILGSSLILFIFFFLKDRKYDFAVKYMLRAYRRWTILIICPREKGTQNRQIPLLLMVRLIVYI
ncbi:uncharacterized protein LOC110888847 isoform X2 [Helianthus annuus]|uniref:uncharacterized protein LOC110888847 isoform X2 n=1 Tax=Helianthus annuus TaxID=4232 RepID=UPI0016531269|nr:uncharacterized protein LOC110888847 isoform X2 [Helianthus annuus]